MTKKKAKHLLFVEERASVTVRYDLPFEKDFDRCGLVPTRRFNIDRWVSFQGTPTDVDSVQLVLVQVDYEVTTTQLLRVTLAEYQRSRGFVPAHPRDVFAFAWTFPNWQIHHLVTSVFPNYHSEVLTLGIEDGVRSIDAVRDNQGIWKIAVPRWFLFRARVTTAREIIPQDVARIPRVAMVPARLPPPRRR